eukprot:1870704-Alexandrium_andersonii.AAC.1
MTVLVPGPVSPRGELGVEPPAWGLTLASKPSQCLATLRHGFSRTVCAASQKREKHSRCVAVPRAAHRGGYRHPGWLQPRVFEIIAKRQTMT